MEKALLFDIKRYSINDGPGIRITLFMKGCPLHCVWCHNPEGISPKVQRLYTKKKCIGCQSCVENCPHHALTLTPDGIVCDKERCIVCGKCAEVCPTLAIEMSGKEYTYDQLMAEIEKETEVMDTSQGGVTFCGGEPLMHPEFLLEMLRRCGRLDIHRFGRRKIVVSRSGFMTHISYQYLFICKPRGKFLSRCQIAAPVIPHIDNQAIAYRQLI